MQIDPALQSQADNYKILTNVVVPRPIAWVTTVNASGLVNLAPYSFFNALGSDPLFVAVSIGERARGAPKDTAGNILASREFVVNMVTEDLLSAMNLPAADFPPDISELEVAGLHVAPAVKITTPRLAAAQEPLALVACLAGD
jgi:flavin reductase (DIM6/NTAB) family NADH-FMN oxidoreductase RutF